jgi:hypothetical protein
MKNKTINNKVFLADGLGLAGVGVVHLASVNMGMGISLLAVGMSWLIIGFTKTINKI